MEEKVIQYMSRSLNQIPTHVILDLENELRVFRDLQIKLYPHFSDKEVLECINKIICLVHYQDVQDYEISNFIITLFEEFVLPLNMISDEKLFEIQQIMFNSIKEIIRKIFTLRGYVNGVFPYVCKEVRLNSDVVLSNTSYLNHMSEMAGTYRGYQFNW